MKFITEYDLRALYKTAPFTSYALPEGARLTPGARQYLLDLGVDMYDRPRKQDVAAEGSLTNKGCEAPGALKKEWLCLKIKTLKPEFLLTAQDLMAYDPYLAHQVNELGRQFCLLALMIEGKCQVADLCCTPCEGINEENYSARLDDCVNVSEFHLQLDNGRAVVLMSRLRSELQLLEKEIEMQEVLIDELAHKLHQIINRLSQLICSAIGGKECQRKM